MRDEFMAGLEDRKYLTIEQVRAKGFQVRIPPHILLVFLYAVGGLVIQSVSQSVMVFMMQLDIPAQTVD